MKIEALIVNSADGGVHTLKSSSRGAWRMRRLLSKPAAKSGRSRHSRFGEDSHHVPEACRRRPLGVVAVGPPDLRADFAAHFAAIAAVAEPLEHRLGRVLVPELDRHFPGARLVVHESGLAHPTEASLADHFEDSIPPARVRHVAPVQTSSLARAREQPQTAIAPDSRIAL